MSSSEDQSATPSGRPVTDLDELFASTQPVRSAADLAQDGIFDDDELEEFVAYVYAARRADIA